jgi:hypothetical protein
MRQVGTKEEKGGGRGCMKKEENEASIQEGREGMRQRWISSGSSGVGGCPEYLKS